MLVSNLALQWFIHLFLVLPEDNQELFKPGGDVFPAAWALQSGGKRLRERLEKGSEDGVLIYLLVWCYKIHGRCPGWGQAWVCKGWCLEDSAQVLQMWPGAPTEARGARITQKTAAPVYTSNGRAVAAGKQTPGRRKGGWEGPRERASGSWTGRMEGERVACPGALGKCKSAGLPLPAW